MNVERDGDATLPGDGGPDEDGAAQESQPPGDGSGVARPGTRRLSLGDPLDGRAVEDRPESWGEACESESERLARYRAQRPPHHGG